MKTRPGDHKLSSRPQERLVSALRTQERCFGALLEVTRTEHEALRSGDIDTVEELLGKKEHLLRRIARAEAERASSAADLAGQMGLAASATLSELSAGLPAAALTEALSLQEALRGHATQLAELNGRNAAMLRTSLGLLGRWVGFLIRAAEGADTYNEEGGHAKRKRTRVLDRKA